MVFGVSLRAVLGMLCPITDLRCILWVWGRLRVLPMHQPRLTVLGGGGMAAQLSSAVTALCVLGAACSKVGLGSSPAPQDGPILSSRG